MCTTRDRLICTTHDRLMCTTPDRLVCTTHDRLVCTSDQGQEVTKRQQCGTISPDIDLEEKMERLHMNYLRDVVRRLRASQSERQIARDLKISRRTIHKYRVIAEEQGWLDSEHPAPDDVTVEAALEPRQRPLRQVSSVEPYGEVIRALLDQGVEMTAIWHRLQENHGYKGSYSSIRRYVAHLSTRTPEAFVRVHTEPGEEMQVDFGYVGQLFDPVTHRLRKAYVFVATLSYSRHQYAELVFDQKGATWIGLHLRAFEYFGGVPRRVVPDNLKAAVKRLLVDDVLLAEPYRRMAIHFGCFISPTAPRTPRHKGKVESGVHYVKRNFMAGQEFADIHAANKRLRVWVEETAGTRRHGTTHQVPLQAFKMVEAAALLPLPKAPFLLLETKRVKVHPDCHVLIQGSHYSVPYRYIGKTLDAYIGERVVEIFDGTHLVSTHPRCKEAGEWQTRLEDYPSSKAEYLIRTPHHCRIEAERIGPSTSHVVDTLLNSRPLNQLRSVQSILKLEETIGPQRLEAACARAIYYGDIRYRRIKEILNAALDRDPLPDAEDTAVQEGAEQSYIFARSGADFFAPQGEEEAL
jgi:transposase